MNRKLQILIAGIILCSINFVASANDDNKVLWGVKATIDAELPGKWHGNHHSVKMFHNGVGFTAGGVSNIFLGKNFYFEPGVSFFYSQYKLDLIIATDGFAGYYKDPKLYKLGVEVPLVFGYTIGFSDKFALDVFTGPQIRYAFGGEVVIKDKEVKEQVGSLLDLWQAQRRFDCSWKIGVGLPINNFTISLEADLGITDLLKEGMTFRENRLALGIAYFFY